jgi:esterase/lipase
MKRLLFSLLLITSSIVSAHTELEVAWKGYLKTVPANNLLQEFCRPKFMKARKNVPYKGTVLAIHGFTACPQQYFEMAERLNDEGFHVLLPLIPGHGYELINGKENFDEIPTAKNAQRVYTSFAQSLNEVMARASGEKIIVGLSVGGTISLLATELNPDLYDRSLAISPFLKASKVANSFTEKIFKSFLGPGLMTNIGFGKKKIGWGEGCEIRERNNGRHGICNFRVTHVTGVEKLGDIVMKNLSSIKAQTQIVGVEKDPAISNKVNLKFFNSLKKQKSQAALCFYPKPANHSLLSRFDAPDEDKFWLESVLQDFTTFVTKGEFIGAATRSTLEQAELCNL